MLKSKGRPVQGQISSKYYKIHLRGVVKVLFGHTYRYPRAMFCSQWLYSYGTRTATCICYSYGSQYISLDFSVIVDSCLSKLSYLPLEGVPFF